ncbi:unnamed protein product [Gadus morhua 'NCC']
MLTSEPKQKWRIRELLGVQRKRYQIDMHTAPLTFLREGRAPSVQRTAAISRATRYGMQGGVGSCQANPDPDTLNPALPVWPGLAASSLGAVESGRVRHPSIPGASRTQRLR